MKPLHAENINTPEHFDSVWERRELHRYDTELVRHFARMPYIRARVCDLGAGVWGVGEYLADFFPGRCEVTCLDFSARAKAQVDARGLLLVYYLGDVLATPFRAGEFDFTVATEVVEHMKYPYALAAEMARITRPGGLIALSTLDHDSDDARRHGDYPEHLWALAPADLNDLVALYGTPEYARVGNCHTVTARLFPA